MSWAGYRCGSHEIGKTLLLQVSSKSSILMGIKFNVVLKEGGPCWALKEQNRQAETLLDMGVNMYNKHLVPT